MPNIAEIGVELRRLHPEMSPKQAEMEAFQTYRFVTDAAGFRTRALAALSAVSGLAAGVFVNPVMALAGLAGNRLALHHIKAIAADITTQVNLNGRHLNPEAPGSPYAERTRQMLGLQTHGHGTA